MVSVFSGQERNCEINGERHAFNFANPHLSSCGSVFVCQRFFPTSRTEVCIPYRSGLPIYDSSGAGKQQHLGHRRQQQRRHHRILHFWRRNAGILIYEWGVPDNIPLPRCRRRTYGDQRRGSNCRHLQRRRVHLSEWQRHFFGIPKGEVHVFERHQQPGRNGGSLGEGALYALLCLQQRHFLNSGRHETSRRDQ